MDQRGKLPIHEPAKAAGDFLEGFEAQVGKMLGRPRTTIADWTRRGGISIIRANNAYTCDRPLSPAQHDTLILFDQVLKNRRPNMHRGQLGDVDDRVLVRLDPFGHPLRVLAEVFRGLSRIAVPPPAAMTSSLS